MRKSNLRIAAYLGHMLQAIERIQRYTEGMTGETFLTDQLVQDAVIRNLEIIGEAARNIQHDHAEFAAAYAHVPWEEMYLMRNRITHGYFSVDAGIVWQTLLRDLPVLHQQLAQITHP